MGTHPIFESDFDCLTDSCIRHCHIALEWRLKVIKNTRVVIILCQTIMVSLMAITNTGTIHTVSHLQMITYLIMHTTMAMEIIIMGTMELMMEAQFHTIRIIKTNRI